MRALICIVKKALRVWWMTALCVVLLAGCKTYVPVETIKTEMERVVDIQRDSIYVLDSVFVREVVDTVFVTRWRVEYKEALRVDTLHIVECDSIYHIVEVERQLTKLQQTKMDVGAGVLYAVPILIAVGLFVLYRKLKK